MNTEDQTRSGLRRFTHGLVVVGGAFVLALSCFLVLPLLQAITKTAKPDLMLRQADVAAEDPPPPVEEQQEEEEEPEPPPQPDVNPEAPPLDLSQLEATLNPDFGSGIGGLVAIGLGDFGVEDGNAMEKLFGESEMEEQPRAVFRARPRVTSAMKKRMPCTVYILMTVNEQGRVENPSVQSSDDRIFDAPALAAVKQWKFEPGKRQGRPDSFRVRQPITFK